MKRETQGESIIHPGRAKGEKRVPPRGIFLPNPPEAGFGCRELQKIGGRSRKFFHSSLVVSREEDFFVAGPAVGAPMAVLALEKLIALGAEEVVLISCCGSVHPDHEVGDLILPGRAVCGEGTSPYYGADKDVEVSEMGVERVQSVLEHEGFGFHGGSIWSTDAPYREERSVLTRLWQEEGVVGVDMELSAMAAAARFRGISLAAVFVVSDLLLTAQWQPGFHWKRFRDQSKGLIHHFFSAFERNL